MKSENPLQIFVDESPEVQKAYAGFIQSLIELKGLDAKTKQLIYIGMKMVTDDERAVRMHVPMAKNAGATRDEVKATVLLGLSVIGLKAASKFLPIVLECYDR
ncbi:MAG: carboxymuconolactone decarboxylase family protein [Bacteroidales bacterium]|nr:carboxymuconolactone decarboxylase family protein [Bacteroidales bacterium]MCF8458327.1 carboxymuconolactone decarboxylase family protein [Bacteroidales bacterium]